MSSAHIFIQPWINRDEHWEAFVLSCGGASPDCERAIADMCMESEDKSLENSLQWFVPVNEHTDLANTRHWPIERTVLLLEEPPKTEDDEAWLEKIRPILDSGYRLALVAHPGRQLPPISGPWKWLVVPTVHARTTSPYTLMGVAARMALVVTNVANRSDFDWAIANSAQMMTGEYILRRNPQTSAKPDVTRVRLLKLLSLVTQDADTAEIEAVFRQEPKLSYSLLRLVNSVALRTNGSVTSYSQAINILGRRQLQRWIQLLVYADAAGSNQANPLLLQAALRGRLIELASAYAAPSDDIACQPDEAFMVGIFSLLDVLLGITMDDILGQLPLAENVKHALSSREGTLGKLLYAVESAEQSNFDIASQTLLSLGIGCEDYATVQLEALNWAHHVGSEA